MSADRGMGAASLLELAKLSQRTGHLFTVYLDDETVRGTDLYIPISWGGNSYPAQGHFFGYEGFEENTETQVQMGQIYLSGVDQLWSARVLEKEFVDRRCTVHRAHLDASWNVIVDPVAIRDGLMGESHIEEDEDAGKSVIVVEVTNHLRDFDNKRGRHTNDEEQRLLYSTDGFFKYAAQANRQLRWGAADAVATTTPPSSATPAPTYYEDTWSNASGG